MQGVINKLLRGNKCYKGRLQDLCVNEHFRGGLFDPRIPTGHEGDVGHQIRHACCGGITS